MPSRPPITLTINGDPWLIRFVRYRIMHQGVECDGICNHAKREIRISAKLRGPKLANRLAHEIIHARVWDLDEEPVSESADVIAHVLYHQTLRELLAWMPPTTKNRRSGQPKK